MNFKPLVFKPLKQPKNHLPVEEKAEETLQEFVERLSLEQNCSKSWIYKQIQYGRIRFK